MNLRAPKRVLHTYIHIRWYRTSKLIFLARTFQIELTHERHEQQHKYEVHTSATKPTKPQHISAHISFLYTFKTYTILYGCVRKHDDSKSTTAARKPIKQQYVSYQMHIFSRSPQVSLTKSIDQQHTHTHTKAYNSTQSIEQSTIYIIYERSKQFVYIIDWLHASIGSIYTHTASEQYEFNPITQHNIHTQHRNRNETKHAE